jgi:diacylglycerol kinase family enzyme
VLGVTAVRVDNAFRAVGLLRGRRAAGLRVLSAREVTVTADEARLAAGIDGEAASLPVPVRCAIRPGALRVWVPRDRPGAEGADPGLDWARLRALAGTRDEN